MEETSRALAGYHDSRLTHDPKRDIVWAALWRYYFRHHIGPRDTVLDLGCGHGEFINNVVAGRRIALDMWPDFPRNIARGVETIVAPVTGVSLLEDGAIDFAFASNLFEHVTQSDFAAVLATLRAKLSPRCSINLLQPNYRYCASEYFDDYTHVSIYTNRSLCDLLAANGFRIENCVPRFLPLTIKSRMPVQPWLIRLYLASPFKPLGKQMLITAIR